NFIDEPTAQLRQAAYVEKKADALVGRTDVPRQVALAAPVAMQGGQPLMVQQPVQQAAPNMQAGVGDINRPMPVPQVMQQAGPSSPPGAAPAVPTPGKQMQTPVQPAAMTSPSDPPAPARRRRRTAAEMAQAQPQGQVQPAAQPAPQPPQAPFPVS